jgi:HK97 family phage prohead protease
MPHQIERRIFRAETRAEKTDDGRVLSGLAAPFGIRTKVGGMFEEVFRKGAFRKTVSEAKKSKRGIVGLWNHDTGKPLSRLSKDVKTLTLREESDGLYTEMSLGSQSWADDAHESVQRGDSDGQSVGMRVIKETWTEPQNEDELPLREILEASLMEVSHTPFAQYETTTAEARSIIESRAAHLLDTSEPGISHSEAEARLLDKRRRWRQFQIERNHTTWTISRSCSSATAS